MKTDRRTVKLPGGVVVAAFIGILFLALFTLEIRDEVVNKGSPFARSLYFFPLVVGLLWGLLTHRRWALLAARGLALLASLWFGFIAAYACIDRPVDARGRVWIWLAVVSLVLGSLVATAFFGLGRPSCRRHYGLACPGCRAGTRGLRAYLRSSLTCDRCGKSWKPESDPSYDRDASC